ncbi:MAG: response regulator [Candidatus Portnoybacteria bacterium CG23_combo_of_CG06-09_8_20_14_all_37_13]|uniref:Response regulator n=2 Tax=Candidatus Portnoyibacteriota TaxID=1817913 RepID=A0A2M7BUL6_9BACT|nr:MAG: response regulator [Candidatus Portnoybacteria bacterium CG23_combo_of_CG06-09_8_20_14_all_37_13]PIV10248.1 MAG: response regulator [Candidatus Portnoybacteria bacterium CG03_land_8_20_14_0_80_41_10]
MTDYLENKETKIKVLIVEDDRFLRELLIRKLEGQGFIISTAVEGKEVLSKAKEELPQLILLDLILPGIDGFEVLKQIKEDSQINKIPVIILSNLGQQEEVEKGLKLGAADYLVKAHFTPDEIIGKIKEVLGKS